MSTTTPTPATSTTTPHLSPLTKALQSAKKAWKSHHDSVTAAYETYYGGSPIHTPTVSPGPSTRPSEESARSVEEGEAHHEKKEGAVRKSFEGLKRKVVEHHQSVNAAYESYYGAHGQQGQH
ncbi:hypothetical protein P154DRAFT_536750 [Amniculicola lignicola CBS 123094]|uniref:Uncharacterized protein n=1 Tax=Amniculicola lignicola CBS 123094 TaxID=1392246 RepID=A0A6A5WJN7_9PLEO|nr:hypothetical protein P154DRAFT_536750 [Amniculicola lignicola CBS 123094]